MTSKLTFKKVPAKCLTRARLGVAVNQLRSRARLWLLLLAPLYVAPGFGEAIYIRTQGTSAGWNTVNFHQKVAISNLVNRSGAPTPVGINVVTNFTGLHWNNATRTPLDAAAEFAGAGITQAYGQNVVVDAWIHGLLPGNSYDFTFYASRIDTANNFKTLYQVAGDNLGSDTLVAGGNTDQVARVQGIIADSRGEARLTIDKAAGNTGNWALLLALKIEGDYNRVRYVAADARMIAQAALPLGRRQQPTCKMRSTAV